MSWVSGSTSYLIRESPEGVMAGLRTLAEREGLRMLETPTHAGVRLTLEMLDDSDDAELPAFEVGEVELRFETQGELMRVQLSSQRRRRWWTLGVVGLLGVGTVCVDLIASMGMLTLELSRSVRRSRAHHELEEPRLLHVVSSFLGRRDLGERNPEPFRSEQLSTGS